MKRMKQKVQLMGMIQLMLGRKVAHLKTIWILKSYIVLFIVRKIKQIVLSKLKIKLKVIMKDNLLISLK